MFGRLSGEPWPKPPELGGRAYDPELADGWLRSEERLPPWPEASEEAGGRKDQLEVSAPLPGAPVP